MSKLKRWPILFKKAKTGKVLTWEIWVRDNKICTASGEKDGKQKESCDTVKAGKNIGRANETTPHEQAVAEAQAKFNKQVDRGYVESEKDALAGKVSEKIEGGYFPQLAENYIESKKHIVLPGYVQPKLDGLRATRDGSDSGFWSRSRKPFPTIRHLEEELRRLGIEDLPLDGELYSHELKDEFEEIVGAVKRGKTEHPKTHKIEYHIFDIPDPELSFSLRYNELTKLKEKVKGSTLIKIVPTFLVSTEGQIEEITEKFLDQGYEGSMIRNSHGGYEFRRSKNLQKYKLFNDDEFRVVGILEGRGALQGHVGKFVCEINDEHGKRTFESVLSGKDVRKFLKKAFEDHSLWKGRWLRVQYQGFTNKNKLPRFPVGLNFRDDED